MIAKRVVDDSKRSVFMVCCAAAAFAGGALPLPAVADSGESLLLPASVAHEGEGTPASRRAAQQLARSLGSGSTRVVPPERARARFEQRGSTAPLMVSHGDLDALAHDAQMALYHVASGLPSRARQDVERALARADKVLESLNRESLAAQQLLDACLYLVRAHLQSNERQAAREQALECRRLVPDIEPDGTMHPPDVNGILAEAEAELRQREPGSLRIESAPDGCAVYVNGRHLGEAPLELPQLSPGEYRVQAECEEGRAGRVHRLTIGSTRVVKRIDTRFDAAVQTSLDVALRYETPEAQVEHAYDDAVEVGRIVGASEVLLVVPVIDEQGRTSEVVQVDRLRVLDAKLLAAVRLRVPAAGAIDGPLLSAAIADLRGGVQSDHSSATMQSIADVYAVAVPSRPAAVPSASAVPQPESAPPVAPGRADRAEVAAAAAASAIDDDAAQPSEPARHPPTTLGLVLGVTGAALTLASWGLYARQLQLEAEYSDAKGAAQDTSAKLHDLDSFELVPIAFAASGAAVLTTSLPWLLPSAQRVPAWSWIAGGAGAAFAITGAALLIRGGNCSAFDLNGRCTDIISTSRLGGLLLIGSLPWLSVPFVYLLRGGPERSDTNSVSLLPATRSPGAQLTWRGRF